MITGTHALLYTSEPEAVRAFFRDILGFDSVDTGDGWLIFALPPAELGIHPADPPTRHELTLLCDDVEGTVRELQGKGVEFTTGINDQGWGLTTRLRLPDGSDLLLYEPKHARPG
jgi:catechol 2,3-dioxygenase-like lactoylglutathione lyase family enzyme